jgi:hypothetical protein
MADMTCVRCQAVVSPQLIDFEEDGAVCRNCIVKAASDPMAIAKGERELMRSMGWRHLIIGLVMLAIGISLLALGLSGAGTIVVIPVGMLVGGVIELINGITKLSR